MSGFSPDLLERISRLNRQLADEADLTEAASTARGERRQPASAAQPTPKATSTTTTQDVPRSVAKSDSKARTESTELEVRPREPTPRASGQLPPGEVISTASGDCYRIASPLDSLWRGAANQVRRGGEFLRMSVANQEQPHPDLQHVAEAFPNRAMFLDLETCGFAGAVIFLIGLLHVDQHGRLQLTQWLARNYREEKAILHAMWATAQQCDVLLTFNGKSFDWPCVHDRSTLHHLGRPPGGKRQDEDAQPNTDTLISLEVPLPRDAARPELVHCDLLHHSRRRWRDSLPNCKLQTLERCLFGRRRSGDIPGSEIPAAYHQFVRSGDAWEIRNVLHHNALDLITLLQLTLKMAES